VTLHELWTGFGYLGAALGVVMVVPQIVRIVRHPALAGVSTVSWAVTALTCLGWMVYGIRTDEIPQVPGNLLLVTGATAVVLLVAQGPSRSRRALLLGAAAAVLLAITMTMPAEDVGYFSFTLGLFAAWPQLFDSINSWRAHTVSGVSVSTWTLRVGSQICWLTYAIGTPDLAVEIAAVVNLSTAVVMVALETSARSSATAQNAAAAI
jgi:uncharacterized protein with PQ loop repeat